MRPARVFGFGCFDVLTSESGIAYHEGESDFVSIAQLVLTLSCGSHLDNWTGSPSGADDSGISRCGELNRFTGLRVGSSELEALTMYKDVLPSEAVRAGSPLVREKDGIEASQCWQVSTAV